jgi:hypothetical protein
MAMTVKIMSTPSLLLFVPWSPVMEPASLVRELELPETWLSCGIEPSPRLRITWFDSTNVKGRFHSETLYKRRKGDLMAEFVL